MQGLPGATAPHPSDWIRYVMAVTQSVVALIPVSGFGSVVAAYFEPTMRNPFRAINASAILSPRFVQPICFTSDSHSSRAVIILLVLFSCPWAEMG